MCVYERLGSTVGVHYSDELLVNVVNLSSGELEE
jgi:hypothetical protein